MIISFVDIINLNAAKEKRRSEEWSEETWIPINVY